MHLTLLAVLLAITLGSGAFFRGVQCEAVELFKQQYMDAAPERLLGGIHHFGEFRPGRLERAPYTASPVGGVGSRSGDCSPQNSRVPVTVTRRPVQTRRVASAAAAKID
eukprot:TRINITY_DN18451_c0_g1_i2.p1 TRINITY_DN18451_c0_g1~~TRINITY_DN18451_c0_g1_i2.p1  ORF type:complete len:109 (+),score=0.58 TRINITY_DN18451_c0_g1_i2:213-539(+)